MVSLVNPLTSTLTGVPGSPASRSGRSRSARYGLRIRWRRTASSVEENATGATMVYSGVPAQPMPWCSSQTMSTCCSWNRLFSMARTILRMHLSGAQAAAIEQAARVRGVVLTHIPPWHEPERVLVEAKPHFDGPVSLATPGFGTFPVFRLSS